MKPRVVVALLSEEQEFQVMQAADAREAAARLGLEVQVLYAEGHAVVQIQQLFRYIHAPQEDRPAAIVVEATTAEGLERVARNALQAGIGWVLINTSAAYVDHLRREHADLPVAMVSADQREVGRIQGRQCRALLPKGGRVLCVQGPADSTVTRGRLEGMQEALGRAYDVHTLNGDWTEAGGEKAVASWLRLKTTETLPPDVVASQNDLMAAGARRALQEHRREWAGVPFLGCDGLREGGQRLVDEGQLAATVIVSSNTGPALELVATWLRTRHAPQRELLLAPRSYPSETQLAPYTGG
jgi:ribose transport system substrate-binding protein